MMTEQNKDKQYLLDLLVDGELADDQRRDLLAWCEREPDGWRRCALAFLEAQNWSQVLGHLASPARKPPVFTSQAANDDDAKPHAVRPLIWRPRQWRTMLAMAASVALAFTLGTWVHDAGKVERIASDDPASIHVVENKSPSHLSRGRPEPVPPQAEAAVGGSARAADETQSPAVGDGWLLVEPSVMPAEVRRALERMGHRVEQRRQLLPYRLDDGRRVMVPVEQVEVQPVGNRTYQ